MTSSVRSELFQHIRAAWPGRPYPLVVDHLDSADGQVCPAAALYSHGKVFGDRLKEIEARPGDVVACFPSTWIEWVGMLQACLRRGLGFAPLEPGAQEDRPSWAEAVSASIELSAESVTARSPGRRVAAGTLIVGPPAVALTEAEVLQSTLPRVVDPVLAPEDAVWLDHRLAPVAKALAIITLLRAGVEIHVGMSTEQAVQRAPDDHRLFDGAGGSSTMAAVRGWAECPP